MVNKQVGAVVALFIVCLATPVTSISLGGFATAADTLQVPSQQYPTIQSALNAATNGSIINVASGIYNENLTASPIWVNGTLTSYKDIIIQCSANTIINGDVYIGAHTTLKMSGFTINGHLRIGNNMEAFIKQCTFTNIKATSFFSYSTESTFSNLQISTTASFSGTNNIISHSVLNVVRFGGNAAGTSTVANRLEYNTISGGVYAAAAVNAQIVGNVISGSEVGITEVPMVISRYGSGGLNIINNTIQNCKTGLNLGSSTYYHYANTIAQNTIKDNDVGLAITFGAYPSLQNTFYQNNFMNNKISVTVTENGIDIWNSGIPPNGNYWSDYTGSDGNNDGIGDTPYIINQVNKDNYPLMKPSGYIPFTPTPTPTTTPTPTPSVTSSPTATPNPPPPTSDPTATTDPTATPTTQPTPTPTVPASTPTPNPPAPTVNPTTNPTAANDTQPIVPETNILFVALLVLIGTSVIVLYVKKANRSIVDARLR